MAQHATAIQSVFRGHRARKQFQDRVFELAWRELDADDEKELIQRDEEVGDVRAELRAKGFPLKKQKRSPTTPTAQMHRIDLVFPLTAQGVSDMMEAFTHGSVLSTKSAQHLVESVETLLRTLPTVVDIRVPTDGRLIVCGDTHGQYGDVRTILRMNGMPSEDNLFMFNGDFVDRGPNGAEVLFSLFALKLLYPNFMFLNRGNHEVGFVVLCLSVFFVISWGVVFVISGSASE
jgi:hypothetical protein